MAAALALVACSRKEASGSAASARSVEDAAAPAIDASAGDAGDPSDGGAAADAAIAADAGDAGALAASVVVVDGGTASDAIGLGTIGISSGRDPCPGCGMGGRLKDLSEGPKATCNVVSTEPEIQRAKPRFTKCYAEALKVDPSLSGRIDLQLEVTEEGRIVSVEKIGATGSLSAQVDACVRVVARSLVLKPGKRTIRVPIVLSHEH